MFECACGQAFAHQKDLRVHIALAIERWPVARCTLDHYDENDPADKAFLRWLEVADANRGLPRVPVIIESPYRGSEQKAHKLYLQRCILDSIARGEAPFASHQMYTVALDDGSPQERTWGIQCGFAWLELARRQVFYTDLGWSPGMIAAWEAGEKLNKPWTVRGLHDPGQLPKHLERRPLQHVDP